MGLTDGPNTYSYVQNNPVNYVDPTGLISVAACANPINAAACAAAGIIPAAVSGASTGAIVSGGINLVSQLSDDCRDFSWSEFGSAVGTGAISGALVGGAVGAIAKNKDWVQAIDDFLPRIKPLKSEGGKTTGWTLSRGKGYGSKPRIDYHFLPGGGNGANGVAEFAKGRRFLHYHRRGPGGIGLHRPWQAKPSWKWWEFWKRF